MVPLSASLLRRAYAVGVFPMAEDRHDPTYHWIEPKIRAVLPLEAFHVPRSLRKTLRRNRFEIRIDTAFTRVVEACAEPGRGRERTWINDPIIIAYTALHIEGDAHSVECWREDRLVGGLYGVALGGVFFGESMFSREPDASKVALVHLVTRLGAGGYTLLDCQFLTEHLRRFGVIELTRRDYLARLGRALRLSATFYPPLPDPVAGGGEDRGGASASAQSSTQRS